MTIRPIIFSAPMVRALIAGTKTMTRRLSTSPLRKCVPGDLLWVRENVRRFSKGSCDQHINWIADDRWNSDCRPSPIEDAYAVPSIHMPRWASRLTLAVTATRFERLQAIREDDAMAEGIYKCGGSGYFWADPAMDELRSVQSARHAFKLLWESIHGAGSWDKNPEVVALSFDVEKRNVDGGGWDGWWEQ